MKAKRQGLLSFFRDSTGGFNLGTIIAICAFAMLCRIAEKDRHPDAWVVAPFTLLVVSYFVVDTAITRAVANSQKQVPDTQVTADTAPVTAENATVNAVPTTQD